MPPITVSRPQGPIVRKASAAMAKMRAEQAPAAVEPKTSAAKWLDTISNGWI